jgi:hypothetical protein
LLTRCCPHMQQNQLAVDAGVRSPGQKEHLCSLHTPLQQRGCKHVVELAPAHTREVSLSVCKYNECSVIQHQGSCVAYELSLSHTCLRWGVQNVGTCEINTNLKTASGSQPGRVCIKQGYQLPGRQVFNKSGQPCVDCPTV